MDKIYTEEFFFHTYDQITKEIEKDTDYKSLYKEAKELSEKFPVIEKLFHNGDITETGEVTIETLEAIKRYITLKREMQDMIEKGHYMRGHRDCLLYLLHCGILNREIGEKSDLILLIETEDELYEMDKALKQLTGQGHGNGNFGKLDNVYKVIQNNSHPSYSGSEEADEKFHAIISNLNKTPEERAEILRNDLF